MDNLYLAAVTNSGANSLTTFQLTGDNFTKVGSLAFPEQNSGLHLSKDMSHALSAVQSATVQVYARSKGAYELTGNAFDSLNVISSVTFSPDERTVFLGSGNSPYHAQLYRQNPLPSLGYTKLATLDSPGFASRCAFSEDGKYLVFMHQLAPYFKFYKVEDSVVTKLTSPALPDQLSSIAFTKNAAHVIAGLYFSPFLKVFKRTDDALSELTVASLPTSRAISIAVSPDGAHVAMSLASSPYIAIYKIVGDTFTKLSNPASLPLNSGDTMFYSADGQHLVITQYSSPGVNIYRRNGDAYTKIAVDPIISAGNYTYAAAFSPDGNYLAIGTGEAPFLVVLKRTGDTYARSKISGTVPSAVVDTKFFWLRSPRNLSGARGASNIQWTWSAVPGAAGYQIEYGPVGGPYQAQIGSSTSFTQSSLAQGVEYEARVRAID